MGKTIAESSDSKEIVSPVVAEKSPAEPDKKPLRSRRKPAVPVRAAKAKESEPVSKDLKNESDQSVGAKPRSVEKESVPSSQPEEENPKDAKADNKTVPTTGKAASGKITNAVSEAVDHQPKANDNISKVPAKNNVEKSCVIQTAEVSGKVTDQEELLPSKKEAPSKKKEIVAKKPLVEPIEDQEELPSEKEAPSKKKEIAAKKPPVESIKDQEELPSKKEQPSKKKENAAKKPPVESIKGQDELPSKKETPSKKKENAAKKPPVE